MPPKNLTSAKRKTPSNSSRKDTGNEPKGSDTEETLETCKPSFCLNIFKDGFNISPYSEGAQTLSFHKVHANFVFPYGKSSETFIWHMDQNWLPADMLDGIPCKYIDGCVVCEERDYRLSSEKDSSSGNCQSKHADFPKVSRKILKPTHGNILHDVDVITSDMDLTYKERLEVESALLLRHTKDLNLDPSFDVHKKASVDNYNKTKFNFTSKKNGILRYRSFFSQFRQAAVKSGRKPRKDTYGISILGKGKGEEVPSKAKLSKELTGKSSKSKSFKPDKKTDKVSIQLPPEPQTQQAFHQPVSAFCPPSEDSNPVQPEITPGPLSEALAPEVVKDLPAFTPPAVALPGVSVVPQSEISAPPNSDMALPPLLPSAPGGIPPTRPAMTRREAQAMAREEKRKQKEAEKAQREVLKQQKEREKQEAKRIKKEQQEQARALRQSQARVRPGAGRNTAQGNSQGQNLVQRQIQSGGQVQTQISRLSQPPNPAAFQAPPPNQSQEQFLPPGQVQVSNQSQSNIQMNQIGQIQGIPGQLQTENQAGIHVGRQDINRGQVSGNRVVFGQQQAPGYAVSSGIPAVGQVPLAVGSPQPIRGRQLLPLPAGSYSYSGAPSPVGQLPGNTMQNQNQGRQSENERKREELLRQKQELLKTKNVLNSNPVRANLSTGQVSEGGQIPIQGQVPLPGQITQAGGSSKNPSSVGRVPGQVLQSPTNSQSLKKKGDKPPRRHMGEETSEDDMEVLEMEPETRRILFKKRRRARISVLIEVGEKLGMVQNAMKQLKLSNPQENNQQNQLQVQSQTSTMGDQSQSIAHSQNQTLTHPTTVQAVKSAVMENLKEITETDVLSRKRFSSAYQLGMTTRFMTFMKVEISGEQNSDGKRYVKKMIFRKRFPLEKTEVSLSEEITDLTKKTLKTSTHPLPALQSHQEAVCFAITFKREMLKNLWTLTADTMIPSQAADSRPLLAHNPPQARAQSFPGGQVVASQQVQNQNPQRLSVPSPSGQMVRLGNTGPSHMVSGNMVRGIAGGSGPGVTQVGTVAQVVTQLPGQVNSGQMQMPAQHRLVNAGPIQAQGQMQMNLGALPAGTTYSILPAQSPMMHQMQLGTQGLQVQNPPQFMQQMQVQGVKPSGNTGRARGRANQAKGNQAMGAGVQGQGFQGHVQGQGTAVQFGQIQLQGIPIQSPRGVQGQQGGQAHFQVQGRPQTQTLNIVPSPGQFQVQLPMPQPGQTPMQNSGAQQAQAQVRARNHAQSQAQSHAQAQAQARQAQFQLQMQFQQMIQQQQNQANLQVSGSGSGAIRGTASVVGTPRGISNASGFSQSLQPSQMQGVQGQGVQNRNQSQNKVQVQPMGQLQSPVQGQNQVQLPNQIQGQLQTQNQTQQHLQAQNQVQNQIQGQNQNQLQAHNQMQSQYQGQNQMQNHIQSQNHMQNQSQGQNQMQGQIQVQNQMQNQIQAQNQLQNQIQAQNQLQSQLQAQNQMQNQIQAQNQMQSQIQAQNQMQNQIRVQNQKQSQVRTQNQMQGQIQGQNQSQDQNRVQNQTPVQNQMQSQVQGQNQNMNLGLNQQRSHLNPLMPHLNHQMVLGSGGPIAGGLAGPIRMSIPHSSGTPTASQVTKSPSARSTAQRRNGGRGGRGTNNSGSTSAQSPRVTAGQLASPSVSGASQNQIQSQVGTNPMQIGGRFQGVPGGMQVPSAGGSLLVPVPQGQVPNRSTLAPSLRGGNMGVGNVGANLGGTLESNMGPLAGNVGGIQVGNLSAIQGTLGAQNLGQSGLQGGIQAGFQPGIQGGIPGVIPGGIQGSLLGGNYGGIQGFAGGMQGTLGVRGLQMSQMTQMNQMGSVGQVGARAGQTGGAKGKAGGNQGRQRGKGGNAGGAAQPK